MIVNFRIWRKFIRETQFIQENLLTEKATKMSKLSKGVMYKKLLSDITLKKPVASVKKIIKGCCPSNDVSSYEKDVNNLVRTSKKVCKLLLIWN